MNRRLCHDAKLLVQYTPYTSAYAGKLFQQHFEKTLRKFKSGLSVNLKNQNSTVVKNELRNHSNFIYKIQSLKLVSITDCRVTEAQLAPVLSKTGYNLHGKLNFQSVIMASYNCTQLWLRDTSSNQFQVGIPGRQFPTLYCVEVHFESLVSWTLFPEILTEGGGG